MPRKISLYDDLQSLILIFLSRSVEFTVGSQPVNNFRMIERHFFRDRLLKTFDFEFGYCIPYSKNTCEHIYEFPNLPPDLGKFSNRAKLSPIISQAQQSISAALIKWVKGSITPSCMPRDLMSFRYSCICISCRTNVTFIMFDDVYNLLSYR